MARQSDGYIRHMTATLDVLFMDRRADKHVSGPPGWTIFRLPAPLTSRTIAWSRRSSPRTAAIRRCARPPVSFSTARASPTSLPGTSAASSCINLTCCQCHDHPLIDGYKQEHYYGILAFLNRSFLFTDKATKVAVLAEKAEGDVTFQSVFVKVLKNTGPYLPDAHPRGAEVRQGQRIRGRIQGGGKAAAQVQPGKLARQGADRQSASPARRPTDFGPSISAGASSTPSSWIMAPIRPRTPSSSSCWPKTFPPANST